MTWSWSRLNTVLLLAVLLVLIAMFATRAYGGPLDPPGPPGSTDGVRQPGTPISSLPITITQPGYYYVTRDLTGAPGQPGITISTSNVTIDLGGFRLLGGSSPGDGISLSGGFRNIAIRNGSVRGWNDGVDVSIALQSSVHDVQASSNLNYGFRIGARSSLRDCNASLNAIGIEVNFGVVRNCVVTENAILGMAVLNFSLVEGNFVSFNGGKGTEIGDNNTLRGNEHSGNGGVNDLNVVGAGNVVDGDVVCRFDTSPGPNDFVQITSHPGLCN